MLLAHGVNVNARAAHDCTPLHAALEWDRYGDARWALIDYLRVEIPERAKDPCEPAQREREENRRMEILKLLMAHGAQINAVGGDGDTALHVAARYGRKAAAEMFLARGVDLNARNAGGGSGWDPEPSGQTALLLALRHGFINVAQLLLDQGADVNVADSTGETPLSHVLQETGSDDAWQWWQAQMECRLFPEREAAALRAALHRDYRAMAKRLLAPALTSAQGTRKAVHYCIAWHEPATRNLPTC